MNKVVKIVPTYFLDDSRDKREVSVYLGMNFSVVVLQKNFEENTFNYEKNCKVISIKVSNQSDNFIIKTFKRIFNIFKWSRIVKIEKPVLISGHDLIGLTIGYLAIALIRKKDRPKLIYDSHEYELERNTGRKSSKLRRFMVFHLEKFLIKKASLVIMVNDSIAEEVQMIYKLKEKPLVIRNMPEKWTLEQKKTQDARKELREELNVSEDTFMVMYHGGISPARGIEKMLEAVSKVPGIVALIMGQGSKDYIQALKTYTKTLNIEKRVLFKDAVIIKELWKFLSTVEIGESPVPKTHNYMLTK